MARKGNHQKNGVDRQTKQRKKNSEVLSSKGQGKTSESKSIRKEQLPDDKQPDTPACDSLERDIEETNDDVSVRTEKNVVDEPVSSENDLAGDIPHSEANFTTEESGIPVGGNYGLGHLKEVMRTLLDILRTNSPLENLELAYNAVARNLRICTAIISREVTRWMERQRPVIDSLKSNVFRARDHVRTKVQKVCPVIFRWLMHFGSIILFLSLVWLDCAIRGFDSFLRLGTTSFFSIVWCGILSVFAMVGVTKFLVILVVTVIMLVFLGFVVGLISLAVFGLVLLWLYGSFWTTLLFIIFGGLAFIFGRERIALFIIATYSVYSAWGYVGWLGLLLAFNLAFISTDALIYFLKNNLNQQSTGYGPNEPVNGSSFENGPGFPGDRGPGAASTSGTDAEVTSEDEVARLLNCTDHYSALGLSRFENIDVAYLKREYRKKAMLVHPDKNMGNEKAAESFKKLQNAYEVLLDSVKRKSYDEELRREELLNYFRRFQNVSQKESRGHGSFGSGFARSEGEGEEAFIDSRQIACKKCGGFHAWFLTKKSKSRARWCQDCKEFHLAKDGDGWIEQSSQPVFFGLLQKIDTTRAYVCADSKIYDASQWYICQGMRCPANTHKPSFHVNTSVTSKHHSGGRGGSSSGPRRMPNANVDETMTEEEFYEWLQNAVQSGVFDNFSDSPSSRTGTGSSSSTGNNGSKRKKKGKRQW
ncbi:PREDICTED: uncharacterized protein LOC104802710 [Tarenaya hassleriana]|uniref:uncharacterized protein LOC104802710 n=1 Tax=Tarenaya hassleriana TaxID=28532 RepID=UPI00053C427D|nr:PREDICTED: uncharacterized protein LOC104802710 [Tarenaya hassleriana]